MHIVISTGSTGTDNSQKKYKFLHTTCLLAIDVPEIGRGEILRIQKTRSFQQNLSVCQWKISIGKWFENIFIFLKS